jgi:hypothetical protein
MLDGRSATDFWYPLPADPSQLPPTGDGSGRTGVLHARTEDHAQVTVTAHVLSLPATRPAILVRVHYPDGFRLATVGTPLGTYRTPPETAWQTYLTRQSDGFARAFAPASMYPRVSDRDRKRAVRTGARALRAATADPHRWYAPEQPPDEEWPDGNAVTDLVELTSVGFRSHSDAEATVENMGDHYLPILLEAQDAGFSLDDADDRAWVASAFWWPEYQPHGWADVARLRADGWTKPALAVIHYRLSDARDREQMERRRLNPFETDLTAVTKLMWQAGEGETWISVTGSPSAASRLIENGLTLRDLT